MKKSFSVAFFIFVLVGVLRSQSDMELRKMILGKDSLLFSVGFNTCDLNPFRELVSEDFEFYHDQSGYGNSKQKFMDQIENGLCKLNYKATRELIDGTTKIYPLKENGVIYGVIQEGDHRFYATYPGQEPTVTSEARFTHLWILEEKDWKLRRVLSFDHHAPK